MTFDMTKTAKAKTDQLNFDDLGTKSITVKITGIKGNNEEDQPVSLYYEGDNGKPYKPCLSMRRVLISVWGGDGQKYVGKSLTLYGDPEVTFGKIKVGGIRISHMSDLKEEKKVPLTESKARKMLYTVKPLAGTASDMDETTIFEAGTAAAALGTESYKTWFGSLTAGEKKLNVQWHDDFKKKAAEIDAAKVA